MKQSLFNAFGTSVLSVVLFFSFCSCSGNEPDSPGNSDGTISVSKVSLSPETLKLEEGESAILSASVSPNNATNKNVRWSSADASIATVVDGNVTAVKAGTTTITVTAEDGGKSATCSVTVTASASPSVTIGADHISAVSAVLSGKANLGSTVSSDLTMGIIWSTNAGVLPSNSTKVEATNMDGDYNYSIILTSLSPETTFYFRSYVSMNGQDTYGETKTFTTKTLSSLLSTQDATEIMSTTVILNGMADLSDVSFAYKSIEYGIQHGLSETIMQDQNPGGTIVENAYSVSLKYLIEGTQYWYKAYVRLDGQYYYGALKSFTTKEAELKAVDLGLSVKWGSFNLGASVPEESGGHYAWGELETKDDFSWSTYRWCNGSGRTLTKYCTESNYGAVDHKTVLELADDIAHVNFGEDWRIPTESELDELMTKCTWTWTTQKGKKGYRVTGLTGSSIFLPVTGYRRDTDISSTETNGYYWSSSLSIDNPAGAWRMSFGSGSVSIADISRSNGFSVRPVYAE